MAVHLVVWFVKWPIKFGHGSSFLLLTHIHSSNPLLFINKLSTMSAHDNEDLIDYEDEHDIPNVGGAGASNGGATIGAGDAEGKEKKNFSGIHSTGFRSVYLLLSFFLNTSI